MGDDIRALVDALQRKLTYHGDRLDELEAENERLRDRVAELEQYVDPDPGHGSYDSLSKERKVFKVRKSLTQKAMDAANGRAALGYKDVYWLFDGHPSYAHCYDLMERAAELDGFEYDTSDGSSNRLLVNLDAVNDEAVFHAAKKDSEGGTA